MGGDAEETFEYRNAAARATEKLRNVQHERAVAYFSPTPTTTTITTTTVANKRCCCCCICCCVFFTKPCLLGRVYSHAFFWHFLCLRLFLVGRNRCDVRRSRSRWVAAGIASLFFVCCLAVSFGGISVCRRADSTRADSTSTSSSTATGRGSGSCD